MNKELQEQGPSGLSIAALVTGILWMSIIPIILGAVDLTRIKKEEASPKGKGFDIAGIVLGALGVLTWLTVGIVMAIVGSIYYFS